MTRGTSLDFVHINLTGVFGFFALLRVAVRNLDRAPEVIVVFDGENGVAQRRAIDTGYKTNRSDGTPEPIAALADIKRGLGICGIGWIELGDQEADDVIGTLATRFRPRPVVIMSGDRDFYQLLDSRVRILNTARRAGERLIGPQDVPDRYGVTAGDQLISLRDLIRLHTGIHLPRHPAGDVSPPLPRHPRSWNIWASGDQDCTTART
jgi:5'-3' exonuclease